MRAAWAICGIVAACGGDSGGDEFKCDDPKYGNGTCDLDTTCDAPDVDCFVTFATPDEAKGWYDGQTAVVTAKGMSVAPTDPRFAPTQALLDEGWELYKTLHEVGNLASAQPRLVLIDNKDVNAFVLGDKDRTRAGLAVMVNTGLVDRNAPKEQFLGIMMHEFEHAAGLHVNATVKQRFLHYYKAGASDEPLGFQQADDPAIRAKFDAWENYAQFAGYASDPELSGLPFTSNNPTTVADTFGVFGAFFFKLIDERRAMVNTAACNTAVMQFTTIHNQVIGTRDAVTSGVTATAAQTTSIVNAITAVRDQCFAGVTGDAIVHLARVSGIADASLRGELPPELATEITGKTVITGWFNAIRVARERQRALEIEFMTATGVPWTRLRYFSTEEAADDSAARLMNALGLAPDGAARLLVAVDPELATACGPLLTAPGLIPYGENLLDDHHATCWRVRHQQQVGPTMEARKLPWRRLGPPRQATLSSLMPLQP
jgi:Peptidase family M48